jgi:flavin reductase ActVB
MPDVDDRVDTMAQSFREAMASFPSGVTIVTTTDDEGRWWGFTATSFCSVSVAPPLVLVCLAESAQCHPAFRSARRWTVHVIHESHTPLAVRFATRGEDKFAGSEFVARADGVPILGDSVVRLDCREHTKVMAGDHTVLIGEVVEVETGTKPPVVYFKRKFRSLT